MSLIGELFLKSSTVTYTGVDSRGGYAGTFSVDVVQIESGLTQTKCDIDIEHKNFNEDSWATAGSFPQIDSTGVESESASNLRQQIRLKISVSADSTGWVRVVILPPVWKSA
jgi:hypothetical protein